MAVAPNLQKLIIPGKNYRGNNDPYGRDMRTIEQWANEGIVRKLIAGSNITLTPASGVDAGTGIKIDASGGGGGGASVGLFGIGSGPDSLGDNTTTNGGIPLGPFQTTSFGAAPNYSGLLVGAHNEGKVGIGWVVATDNPSSVVMMPQFFAPAFTGGPLTVVAWMGAVSTDYTNQARWNNALGFTMTTGAVYQSVAADWSNEFANGANLSLVAGTGSGSGIVANNAITYLGSVWCEITWPPGTVFT